MKMVKYPCHTYKGSRADNSANCVKENMSATPALWADQEYGISMQVTKN